MRLSQGTGRRGTFVINSTPDIVAVLFIDHPHDDSDDDDNEDKDDDDDSDDDNDDYVHIRSGRA